MRVFVAGATGTLGAPLVRALVSRGHEVTGLTRTAAKRPQLERMGAIAAVADALDGPALERVVRSAKPNCIFHLLTAIPKNAPLRAAQMRATNELRVAGTANLLRAAVAAGAERVVAESMIFAYGFGDHGAEAKTEADALRTPEAGSLTRDVVGALRSLEEQLRAAHRQGSIETVSLRFGLFYGSECPSTKYTVKMLRRRLLPTVSTGAGPAGGGICSWVHLDDAVSAALAAMERGRGGEVYNIVDDVPANFNEWTSHAARALGAPAPFALPRWLLRLMMPYITTVFDTRLSVSNQKAKLELGWLPQYPDYRRGLEEVAARL